MNPLERKILLYAGDVMVSVAALLLVVLWRDIGTSPFAQQSPLFGWCLLLALLHSIVGPAIDAYDQRAAARPRSAVKLGLRTGLAISLTYLVIPRLTPWFLPSRGTTLIFVLVTTGGIVVWRLSYAVLFGGHRFVRNVAFLGSGPATEDAIEVINAGRHEYAIVEVAANSPTGSPHEIDPSTAVDSLRLLLDEDRIDEIGVEEAGDSELDDAILQVIIDANEKGIAVTPTIELYERLTGRLPLRYLGTSREVLKVLLPLKRAEQPLLNRASKRLIDLAFGLLALLLAAFLSPFLFLANLLEGGGPLLYRQDRVGLAGSTFRIVKFRTMVPDAEQGGPRYAEPKDVRTTRVGRVLRRLHLDELPQGFNIMRGQMSLVGPRPERPAMVEWLSKEVPYYTARHAVLPGLTGWAQVNQQYVSTHDGAWTRLEYDLYYVKHMSILFDLSIVAATVSGLRRFPGQ